MMAVATDASGLPVQPAPPVTGLAPSQQLARNPMLPQHPLGAYTDAQYEAQEALLRQDIQQRYATVLQQLGYTDENGNFVPGSVETNANRQKSDLTRQMGLADEETTNQAQNLGTLFSGIRGTNQARAEFPFAQGLAQLGTDTPTQLQALLAQAGGLMGEYGLKQNQLLADAAARRATAITANPAGAVGADPATGLPVPLGGGGGAAPAPTGTIGPAGLDTGLAPVYGDTPVQPTTYASIGATPDPIASAPLVPSDTTIGPNASPDIVGPGPSGTSVAQIPTPPNVDYTAGAAFQAPPVTPDTTGADPNAYGGVASPEPTSIAAPTTDTTAFVDPHQAITDIHQASVSAIQKLAAARDQRLGF